MCACLRDLRKVSVIAECVLADAVLMQPVSAFLIRKFPLNGRSVSTLRIGHHHKGSTGIGTRINWMNSPQVTSSEAVEITAAVRQDEPLANR